MVFQGQRAHLIAPLLNPVAITLTEIPSGAAENSKQLIKSSHGAWLMNLPLTVHSLITLPSSIVLSSETYFTKTSKEKKNVNSLLNVLSRKSLSNYP